MGKHFWMKHLDDESRNQQPGCMSGLVHMLGYHHRRSNVGKMIHYRKDGGGTYDRCDLSPHSDDAYEAEKLLDVKRSPSVGTKRSRAAKKRSLKARIKALIAEEVSKENNNTQETGGFSSGPSLQRTYSFHRLESEDIGLGKIRTRWKHPIIFFPRNVENGSSQSFDTTQTKAAGNLESIRRERDMYGGNDGVKIDSKEEPDVFEIFKVDKELLLKHLQDSDKSIANSSRGAFGLNTKAKFSKSRSFPVAELAQRGKIKPVTLESKHKEVWSFPREDKQDKQRDNQEIMPSNIPNKPRPSESFDEVANREAKNAKDRIGEKHDENGIRKRTHRRSSSLNESLDKYARLFENTFAKDAKFSSSKSLKLPNEYGLAPMYIRRMRSLSALNSYYSNISFDVLGDNSSGNDLVVIAEGSGSGLQNSEEENVESLLISDKENVPLNANKQIKEDYPSLRPLTRDDNCQKVDGLEEEADELRRSDCLVEKDSNCSGVADEEFQHQGFVLGPDICLQETESHSLELQISEGMEHGSRVRELNPSIDTNDVKSLQSKPMSTYSTPNLENDKISVKFEPDGCRKKKNSDLDYVRHLLRQSGIAVDATEITWHASNQPFSPQLFEKVESDWPHEEDQLTGWPDFYGCWHHQMLFDLVNEVLLDVYDTSLPYYPKALSSSCHVRPFPSGNHIIEEVCTSVGMLLDMKPEEKQSLDSIVARDLARDHSWMNLQLETEVVALDLEDLIFGELLQEVVFS